MTGLEKYKFNRYIPIPKKFDNGFLISKVGMVIVFGYFALRILKFRDFPIFFIDGLIICITVAYFFNREKIKKQSMYKYEPLKGQLFHDLVFTYDAITIEQTTYPLDYIFEIKFVEHEDFYGALKYKNGNFEGALSQGVYNFLVLKLKSGEEVHCQFQQATRHELRNLRPMLEKYYEAGLINFKHLVDILRIESMNEREILRVELERKRKAYE
ncbi:hypothetical protein K5I29_12595 [Flavobacterium agricola]|uniref:PrgI family protein n=1 Tax=Flavobacterium agricola TaxID=2870839 RepID=A0ABY6M0S5_9FLAO|nr:hypothetical protein [Flavobacterium agricola]UYW01269.1 hypothetical protein K5I29_12595 [Flavobacterium agricola]